MPFLPTPQEERDMARFRRGSSYRHLSSDELLRRVRLRRTVPDVFLDTYWGSSLSEDLTSSDQIVANRIAFQAEYQCVSRPRSLSYIHCQDHFFDHRELYKCVDGRGVFLISPYTEGGIYDDTAALFGLAPCPWQLYSTRTHTFMRVEASVAALRQWWKELWTPAKMPHCKKCYGRFGSYVEAYSNGRVESYRADREGFPVDRVAPSAKGRESLSASGICAKCGAVRIFPRSFRLASLRRVPSSEGMHPRPRNPIENSGENPAETAGKPLGAP